MKNSDFPMKQFLEELETVVNMDSGTSDLEGCRQVASFYKQRMKQAGLLTQYLLLDAEDANPVIGAITQCCARPRMGSKPYDFLFVGHMDTVFPRGTAAQRPFRLEYEDGRPVRAYGPSTVDMKAGTLLMIYIAEYLAKHYPDLRIGLLLNSDEETGSADSLKKLHFWGGQTDMIFVFEGGRKQDQFVTQRKGCNKYEIRVSGISAHAGTSPWKGANAIVQMGHLVTALDDLKNYNRGTSVNVGLISGGTALNVVPDSCTAQMEVRYSDPKEMTRVKHAIDKLAKRPPKVEGTKVEFELLRSTQPLREFAYTQKVMDKMRAYESRYRADLQELKDAGSLAEDCPVYPVEFIAAGGLSDANRLAACHVPVIDGCGPGGGNPHRPDEYLTIDTVLKRFVYFTGLLPWMKGM